MTLSCAQFMVGIGCYECESSDFLFPLQPPHPLPRQPPPARPTAKSLISVHFSSVSAPFGSVRPRFGSVSGLFRVRFRVLGGLGVGSGRGASVREKNITMRESQTCTQLRSTISRRLLPPISQQNGPAEVQSEFFSPNSGCEFSDVNFGR